jgi:tetratricopeptide (TPR) repeat protein
MRRYRQTLHWGLAGELLVLLAVLAPADEPAATKLPWQRLLQGDDARKAQELERRVAELQREGKFEEALASAEAVARLRKDRQGKDHWEAVGARFAVEALRRVTKSGKEDRDDYATSLRLQAQAVALEQKGRAREALPLRERARAVCSRVVGEAHPETAQSSNNLAGNLYSQGRYKEAEETYTKALAVYRKALGEEHPDTATCWNNLAATLNAQGRFREAEDGFKKVLGIKRKVYGEEHPGTATSYSNLAHAQQAQGRYRDAEEGFRKALDIRRKLFGEQHPDTATGYNNVGFNFQAQGRYQEAEEAFRKALAIRSKILGEDHPDTATTYSNVAASLNSQGRFKEAEEGYRKSLDILRRVVGEDHPKTATDFDNTAFNLDAQGRHKEAEELYRKALDIRVRVLGPEHPSTANSYNNSATNLALQGRYPEAEEAFRKALAIRRKVLGEDHPSTALSWDNLAFNLANQRRYEEADGLHKKALEINRKVLGEDHLETARSHAYLARTLAAQGRYREAEEGYRKALGVHRKLLGDEHPTTADSYYTVALMVGAQGRYEEAEKLFERGADAFLGLRLQIAGTGLGRAARTSEHSPLLPLAAVLARNSKAAAAWQRLEQSFGRGAWDDLSARLRRPADELARQTELLTRLERIDQALASYRALLTPTPAQEKERDALLDRRREAQDQLTRFTHHLEQTYGPAQGQVFAREQIQAALPRDAALIAWIDIPAGPKAADRNGDHWAVLLRAQGEPIVERLRGSGTGGDWTDEDDTLPQQLVAALEAPEGPWRALARRLNRQRLQPLSKHLAAGEKLPAVRQLIVLPSAALRGLPVELIADEYTVSYASSATLYAHLRKQPAVKSAGLLAVGDPVFESAAAAAKPRPVPPGGVLLTMVQPESNAAKALLMRDDVLLKYGDAELKSVADLKAAMTAADPKAEVPVRVWREGTTFERRVRPGPLGVVLAADAAPKVLAERYRLDRVLASRSGDDGWGQLPGTRVEVESLHRLFGDKPEPRLLFDSEASEQRLDRLASSGELGKYRYLHLATHGEVDDAMPLRSAMILSRDALPDAQQQLLAGKPVYDGRLTAEEMLRSWNLHSDLVTLSACETALGKYESGEGFVGFAQALILCGSRSVCLSLWKVDDGATALLMQRFYANLLGKREGLKAPMSKAAALREAKEWLRNLSREEALKVAADVSQGVERGKGRPKGKLLPPVPEAPPAAKDDHPYAHPYYWAAFVLIGDPN